MKSFTISHLENSYTVSLDWLATRNMTVTDARNHIDIDSIYLFDGKTVRALKEGFNNYKLQGGKLKNLHTSMILRQSSLDLVGTM